MPLPPLIEILPLDPPMRASVTVPGSKSLTNRALILAALAQGQTTLQGALWSEDTQVMVDGLRLLGFGIQAQTDPDEPCNRTITVTGDGGAIPRGGTGAKPLEIFVGNAGTAARFVGALVCLGTGAYRLNGTERMHERPQGALFEALRQLGYQVDSPNGRLPAVFHGTGPRTGHCTVSIEQSSQFASGLLLCARIGGWEVQVTGENAEESPYVAMTKRIASVFPRTGGAYRIEPDASSGSYFWAAGALQADRIPISSRLALPVNVESWPDSANQIDADFPRLMPLKGVSSPQQVSRQTDLGDSIMTAIALAPLIEHKTSFTDLGRLRLQECERVIALRTELTKCGAQVIESGDTLEVFPSALHGAEIETYNDHRMAMCFATLGLKVPGIKLRNPDCVSKTFPNFFQKMATPPPHGLGAKILDAQIGKVLALGELFAGSPSD
jgi:3-phosphoshikimate 1-carboxyvinyltransferase